MYGRDTALWIEDEKYVYLISSDRAGKVWMGNEEESLEGERSGPDDSLRWVPLYGPVLMC